MAGVRSSACPAAARRRRAAPPALAAVASFCLLMAAARAAPGGAPPAAFDPGLSDPRAIALADLVMQALGGEKAWHATHYVHFAFVVEKAGKTLARRVHLWDRFAGRLRFDDVDKDGAPVVVLLDVTTRQGEAYRRGARVEGAAARPLLDEAYEAWINDTYWLLMPYKMKDPGVHLRDAGEEAIDGRIYDRVLLTFDAVGLTPGDRYWAYINRVSHLMDRWSYLLQDDPPKSAPTVWDWRGWRRYGGILLAPEKVSVRKEGSVRIVHPILEVLDTVPSDYFTRPDPVPDRIAGP